jgi:hypothetical protein
MDESISGTVKAPGLSNLRGARRPARQPGAANRQRRMIILGIELNAVARYLGSSRFREHVIVAALGLAALAALARENHERNVARLVAWDQRRNLRDLRAARARQRGGG